MMAQRSIRREARSGAVALALAGLVFASLLSACGDGNESGTDGATAATGGATGATAAGPWTFPDGRGGTVTLESPPERIVAHTETSVAPLMYLGITPIAAFGSAPIEGNPALEGLDTSGIESLGEVYGEINLEKMATLDPDLIVTESTPGFLEGFNDENQARRAEQIAPIVAIPAARPSGEVLEDWIALGEALGVDFESAELTAARERFEAAWGAFVASAEANPEISVMWVSTDSDGMYVAGPPLWGDLQDWQVAGLDVVEPDDTAEFDGYWELLSWEQPEKYLADVILWDNRPYSYLLPPEELDLPGTWDRLPAVAAGQVGPWAAGTNTSWQVYAEHLEALTALIEGSEDIV